MAHSREQRIGWQLCDLSEGDSLFSCLTISKSEHPTCWRLTEIGDDPTAVEEIVLRLQGIITEAELPPILSAPRGRRKGLYMRQSVTLTGLGVKAFEQAIDSAISIHALFSRHFPPGALETWQPSFFLNHHTITAYNRHFSEKRLCPCVVPTPFTPEVDPKGILTSMLDDKLVHSEENEVKYYESVNNNPPSNQTYIPAHPTAFRPGDIVEVQVSFIVVGLKGDKYKMLCILRALTMMDYTHSMNAAKARSYPPPLPASQSVTIKRKVGYEEDRQVFETRRQMMALSMRETRMDDSVDA